MRYKHIRLDRHVSYHGVFYKYGDILVNSYGPCRINYDGDVFVSHDDDLDLYSNGDYIISGWAFVSEDGSGDPL